LGTGYHGRKPRWSIATCLRRRTPSHQGFSQRGLKITAVTGGKPTSGRTSSTASERGDLRGPHRCPTSDSACCGRCASALLCTGEHDHSLPIIQPEASDQWTVLSAVGLPNRRGRTVVPDGAQIIRSGVPWRRRGFGVQIRGKPSYWRGAASCLCQPPVQIAQGLSPAEVSCGRSAGSGERTVGSEAHVRVASGAHVRGGKVPRKRISGQASEVWGGRVVVAGERPADRSSLPWRHLR
jgi:hypothetical protein